MICVLCGISHPNHPLHPTDTLMELVRTRACKGPIVYPVIMTWKQPTICACRLCFHQLRRVKPRHQDRQPLPLDAAILQTVVPGTMRQQDSRTRERICAALRMPGNAYSRTFEALETLLASSTPPRVNSINRPPQGVTGQPQCEEEMEREGENDPETTTMAATSHAPVTAPMTPTRDRMDVWWRYNLQTECFSHKAIARHVRRYGL